MAGPSTLLREAIVKTLEIEVLNREDVVLNEYDNLVGKRPIHRVHSKVIPVLLEMISIVNRTDTRKFACSVTRKSTKPNTVLL